jgi:hypothetical protein
LDHQDGTRQHEKRVRRSAVSFRLLLNQRHSAQRAADHRSPLLQNQSHTAGKWRICW